MLPEEAKLMGEWVLTLNLQPGSLCLNVGSSTRQFREEVQPFIWSELLQPAQQAGLRVVNCDIKAADGVDEVGDILDPQVRLRLARYQADLLICSNLLEHLAEPLAFARACGTLVRPGGFALFTVPLSFPYHPDPIDTLLRLRADELATLLPGWETVRKAEIAGGSFGDDIMAADHPMLALGRHLSRVALPVYRPKRWLPAAHQLLWLFRPYRASLVLLRRPDEQLGSI